MIFADLYKSPKSHFSRFRHSHQPLDLASPAYDADLVSKDKTRQKEAVKRHLQAKVRNDWVFTWPIQEPHLDPNSSRPDTAKTQHDTTSPAVPGEIEGFLEVASENSDVEAAETVEAAEAVDQTLGAEDTALDSGEDADSDSDAASVYSTVTQDSQHWRPRLEWASELSDDELSYNSPPPFKFDTPDSIGHAVAASKIACKARRRRELRKETAWNDGLACFEARRNAWTGAKTVRVRPRPASPISPPSPTKRGLFWRTQTHPAPNTNQLATSPTLTAPLTLVASTSLLDGPQSPSAGAETDKASQQQSLSPKTSHEGSQKLPQDSNVLPVETLLPIPPPLLPPANPMRASISPALYNSIYEKVVVHSLQPSCPINLGDMLRACVAGWKRDGEWPPRPAVPEPAALVAVKRHKANQLSNASSAGSPTGRRMSLSFLVGRGQAQQHEGDNNKDKPRRDSTAGGEEGSGGSNTGKAIRRSLQKVLGIGHNPTLASVADGHTVLHQH